MTAPDPDEAPTRHGGDELPPEASTLPAADRTVPAGEAQRHSSPSPGDRTVQAPVPPPAGAGGNDPLFGKVLGGCRIDKLLGRGAMGAVYKARQQKLDRDVAIKVIRPEMMTDARMLKRFEVEARTVGKFNSAHVVMVHDVGFELGVHYLVMEFVQGKNLRDHVKLLAGGRLPVGEALPLLRQSIKGLEEAQRLHVIHRDIKPDNLMITDRGVLKIADFGIAKPMQEDFSMTLTSELVGTPLYMSPEQCSGHAELDFRSDMYSLGATFYYLLTGEPPIRASSVYELIQTKTKMAHLCLWKALPGLDENNPLSRVIERMTALDREDRYDSYEALLNDLVLVEHGQTVQVPKTGGHKGGKGKPQPSRRGLWLAAALLLVVGGGVAAYALTPPPVVPADSGKQLAEQLEVLRARLAQEGPSEVLFTVVGKFTPTKELAAAHRQLQKEVEDARPLAEALRAIQAPTVRLPFDALRAHFAAIDKVVAAHKVSGVEAAAWRDRAVVAAKDEAALGKDATTALLRVWDELKVDRSRIDRDAARLAAAKKKLEDLEVARTNLLAILPKLGAGLEPSPKDIETARRELADTKVGPVDLDQSGPLREFRSELVAGGPKAALFDRIDKLPTTRPDQNQARLDLLNDFNTAKVASENAGIVFTNRKPKEPQPPFTDVTDYWDAIDRAFDPVRADGKLPLWAVALRSQLRAEPELRDKVVAACTSAFTQWQGSGAGDAAQTARLRETRTRASELFADAATAIEQAIPEAQLTAAVNAAAMAQQRQRWQSDADKLDKRLQAFSSLADWAAAAASVGEAFTALQAGSGAFAGDADVAREQQRLAEAMQRWRTASERMRNVDDRLAAADVKKALPEARAGANGNEGKSEFLLALDAITATETAFGGLQRTLDVDAAATELRTACEKLRGRSCLAATGQRLARWCEALQKLQAASAGMIAIPAGRPKGGGAPVDAFFLAATECSRAEFVQFLTELRAAVGSVTDPQQALALPAIGPRFAGTGINADRLRGLLERADKADRMPIDNITWFTAAACAAWQGRALPTADEWALAAFGDGGVQKYPWGNAWSNESSKRNAGTAAVEVDAGGLSWRSQGDRRLHHLAGNVAEWLASAPAKAEAQLAGGRYNDRSAAVSDERAAGALEATTKDDARRGYGFRTVLRLRGFIGLDWPQ